MANVTTKRVAAGEFDVYLNGEKTRFQIINGSHGYTGNGAANMYGITTATKVVWVGTLQNAKNLVAVWLLKK